MTKNESNTPTAGSDGIPQRRSEGVAGPSREVSKNDHVPSGAIDAGRENEELEWARRHVPEDGPAFKPVRIVFRKTELSGSEPETSPEERRRIRKNMLKRIRDAGTKISYQPFKTAFQEFIRSLREHQDLVAEKLLLNLADLDQRITALERMRNEVWSESPGSPEVNV